MFTLGKRHDWVVKVVEVIDEGIPLFDIETEDVEFEKLIAVMAVVAEKRLVWKNSINHV